MRHTEAYFYIEKSLGLEYARIPMNIYTILTIDIEKSKGDRYLNFSVKWTIYHACQKLFSVCKFRDYL